MEWLNAGIQAAFGAIGESFGSIVFVALLAMCLSLALWYTMVCHQRLRDLATTFERASGQGLISLAKAFGARPSDDPLRARWEQLNRNRAETQDQDTPEEGGVICSTLNPLALIQAVDLPRASYAKWTLAWAGIMLTLGLFFTFVGLTAALQTFKSFDTADAAGLEGAIKDLLEQSSVKFITSIAGIAGFLVLTALARWFTLDQEVIARRIARAVDRHVHYQAPETVLAQQLKEAQAQRLRLDQLADDVATSLVNRLQPIMKTFGDGIKGMGETVSKDINKDIKEKTDEVGKSISEVPTKLDALLTRMAKSGQIYHRGLQRAAGELEQASGSISTKLTNAADEVSTKLTAGASALTKSAEDAGTSLIAKVAVAAHELVEKLDTASQGLADTLRKAIDPLAKSIANLTGDLEATRAALEELPPALEAPVHALRSSGETIASALRSSGETIASASSNLSAASTTVTEAIASAKLLLMQVKDGIEQISVTLGQVRGTQGIVGGTLQTVQATADTANRTFQKYQEAFEGLDEALAKAVSAVKNGLQEVARQTADHFGKYDLAMAKAVDQLRSTSEDLTEALGDIVEQIKPVRVPA